jgi:protein-tyrosine phosphatase
MLETVIFCGKIEAEAEIPRTDWAVISISQFDGSKVQLKSGWHSVLQLQFYDLDLIDLNTLPDWITLKMIDLFESFTREQAWEIIQFVKLVSPEVSGVMVHCRAGISRSAAVAKWIAETLGLPFNHEYSCYNKHVYQMLIDESLSWKVNNA